MARLLIALAQVMTAVGDLEGNCRKILDYTMAAEKAGADVVAFPELSLNGYPPEDMILNPGFVDESMEAISWLADSSGETVSVVGFVERDSGIFNSAAVLSRGSLICTYKKALLPNFGVFDEMRYFGSGEAAVVLEIGGVRVGLTICEDIWHRGAPVETEVAIGKAQVILNISASPFNRGKHAQRKRVISTRAGEGPVVVAYVNAVGAQDELVFDGGSCVCHPAGGYLAEARRFCEELMFCEVDINLDEAERSVERTLREECDEGGSALETHCIAPRRGVVVKKKTIAVPEGPEVLSESEETRKALILGLREYAARNGFEKVVIGVSGGIDSALTAVLAAEALGGENVVCAFMPSKYTSLESSKGAHRVALNIGARYVEMPIDGVCSAYFDALEPYIPSAGNGVAHENIQARARGNLLMALSNSFGWLVLATGNKSELSMGYCTLYGDMAGGYALLKDVFKTQVYALARHVNVTSEREVIPFDIIERPPTAELRPAQLDTDSLPPYSELDRVLEAYIEMGKGTRELLKDGFSEELVKAVTCSVDASEHKRRQAPIGVRISPVAFGRDWRMPVSKGRPPKRS